MSSLALCSTKNFNSWLWHLVLYFTFVFAFVFGSAGCLSLPRSTQPPRTSIAYLGASRPSPSPLGLLRPKQNHKYQHIIVPAGTPPSLVPPPGLLRPFFNAHQGLALQQDFMDLRPFRSKLTVKAWLLLPDPFFICLVTTLHIS